MVARQTRREDCRLEKKNRSKEARAPESMHKQVDPNVVPSDEAWGNLGDLDIKHAYRVFGGKTRNEVQASFTRSVIERADELRFMPSAVFPYYMLAFRDHVEFGHFDVREAGDVFSCYLQLIEERARKDRDSIAAIHDQLAISISRVARSQDAFNIDRSIYGDFEDREKEINRLLNTRAPRR